MVRDAVLNSPKVLEGEGERRGEEEGGGRREGVVEGEGRGREEGEGGRALNLILLSFKKQF
jgi:hypothetical protein